MKHLPWIIIFVMMEIIICLWNLSEEDLILEIVRYRDNAFILLRLRVFIYKTQTPKQVKLNSIIHL